MEQKDEIRISVKGLAKFMTGSHVKQRKILRDFKYPDPEGSAQAIYYREAKDFIGSYLEKGLPADWLAQKGNLLRSLAQQGSSSTAARLRHNARAIADFQKHFGAEKYECLPKLRLAFTSGKVRVTASPDLHIRYRGQEKLLKFEFTAEEPGERSFRILAQGIFAAAEGANLQLKPSATWVLDVPRGARYEASRAKSAIGREIEAACQTIADIWQSL